MYVCAGRGFNPGDWALFEEAGRSRQYIPHRYFSWGPTPQLPRAIFLVFCCFCFCFAVGCIACLSAHTRTSSWSPSPGRRQNGRDTEFSTRWHRKRSRHGRAQDGISGLLPYIVFCTSTAVSLAGIAVRGNDLSPVPGRWDI